VTALQAEIDAHSQLVKLKRRFDTSPQLEAVGQNILSWDVRYDKIKATALAAGPDVLCFQEMDHLSQFVQDPAFGAAYSCQLGDGTAPPSAPRRSKKKDPSPMRKFLKQFSNCFVSESFDSAPSAPAHPGELYVPASYGGAGGDDLRPDNYLAHLLRSRTAFAPKSYSHARNFRTKRLAKATGAAGDGAADVVDDDGVAIFWKRDVLRPVELGFLRIPSSDAQKSDGAVAVILEEIATQRRVSVITAHLPSGDETKKEMERLAVLVDTKTPWTATRTVRGTDGTWTEQPYGGAPFDGLLSFVQHYADGSGTTLFALDSNSRPGFPPVDAGVDRASVWTAVAARPGLRMASMWVQTGRLAPDGGPPTGTTGMPISVNKMRGPASTQPQKIGEHQCELIDHVYTNGPRSQLVQGVDVQTGAKPYTMPTAPKVYEGREGPAELELIPSLTVPSDHLPVLVDVWLRPEP